jgi:hypothetical protein
LKDENKNEPQPMNVSLDAKQMPIFYTDNLFITSNEDGVVIDVGQRISSTNQVQIVARIGMSREHAKKFVDVLSKNMLVNQTQNQTGKKVVN